MWMHRDKQAYFNKSNLDLSILVKGYYQHVFEISKVQSILKSEIISDFKVS
jgi:hypothetical protein